MTLARRDLLTVTLGATLLGPSRAFAASPQDEAAAEGKPDPGWKRFDAKDLGLEGRAWSDVEDEYDRLPARAKELVREPVWKLSKESSGLFVAFETDATEMRFDVEVTGSDAAMYHMPATGVSGVDLYAREGTGPWRWVAASVPNQNPYVASVSGLRPGKREYRLYLPLYNGVKTLGASVPEGVAFESTPPREKKPIVYYGTSIAQGACASRPGMSFVNILGRRLDVPMVNLGLSGNGRLELEIGELMTELDAQMYVVDCLPNLGPGQVAERTVPFVNLLRSKRPDTPIVLVEDRTNPNAPFLPNRARHHEANHSAFRKCYEELLAAGVEGLTYVPDAPFLGDDGEATVDGSHPTDLGMMRYADVLEPILRELI